jgi:protein translocase SecG subunit
MDTMVFTLHLLLWPLCIVIITLILLQGGAGDIASAFGGGGQLDSTLGVGASRKMAKLTGWLAAVFAVVVITLAVPHNGSLGTNSPAALKELSHTSSTGTPSMKPLAPTVGNRPILAPVAQPNLGNAGSTAAVVANPSATTSAVTPTANVPAPAVVAPLLTPAAPTPTVPPVSKPPAAVAPASIPAPPASANAPK